MKHYDKLLAYHKDLLRGNFHKSAKLTNTLIIVLHTVCII